MPALVLVARAVAAVATVTALATATPCLAAASGPAGPPTRIAYSVNGSDGSHMYSTAPDGSDQSTVVDPVSGTVDTDPAYGPGHEFAYVHVSSDLTRYELRVVDGTGPSKLVYASKRRIAEPAFSPDGQRLAFSLDTAAGETRIYSIYVDGTRPRWMTRSVSVAGGQILPVDNSPSWSPDGNTIVFSRRLEGMPPTAALYQVNTTGRPIPRQLTSGTVIDFSPSWSPDGESIVFGREDDPEDIGSTWSVVSVPSGGGTPKVLVGPSTTEISDVAQAPDGAQLAYISTALGSATSTLAVADADGTDPHVVKTVTGRLISVSWGNGPEPDADQGSQLRTQRTLAELTSR